MAYVNQSIDEIFDGVDITPTKKEYITVELIDGEKITVEKSTYEKLSAEYEAGEIGEFLY